VNRGLEATSKIGVTAFLKDSANMVHEPYPTGDLASAFFKHSGLRRPYFQDPYTMVLSPIMVMISWIYHLPIKHRKALLDAARIQASVHINTTLSATFASLTPVSVYPRGYSDDGIIILYPSTIASLFENIWPFPILCSLLSYFVRAENTIHISEFLAEKDISLNKELQAALHFTTIDQALDYTGLFGVSSAHLHPQLTGDINWRLQTLFGAGVQQIVSSFSKSSTRPILPAYNSRKNVSRSTCRNYYEAIGSSMVDDIPTDVTTLDLLKLYYHTGVEVHGEIEMRQAWFFNELKPRTYYCLGGTDFFHGMHVQQIANLFVNILPSTNPFTRFTVRRIGIIGYDELLITYDYSSFTTSLAELRYFLFWLAEYVGDVHVTLLDVATGLREVPLKSILHAYNTAVNHYQLFSLERFQNAEEAILLRQGRSGSLGVKGNIVFSTTLHGLALADISGTPDEDCCVGDDALARIRAWFITIFISCVNNLGSINPEKFTTIAPTDPNGEHSRLTQQYKFLKRPINLDDRNIPILGRLDFFPSVADALFPEGDGVHSVTPGYSAFSAARTFAMQVGRFFRLQCSDDTVPILFREEDLDAILCMFREVYRVRGLPIEGGVPSAFTVKTDSGLREGDFFCPPIDTHDVFITPWMEILLERLYGRTLSLPVTCGGTIPPPLECSVGASFHATSDVQVLTLGVDLGFLEKTVEIRYVVFDGSVCDEVWEKMLVGTKNVEPLLSRYTVVAETPSWWYDVVSYDYPDLLEEDPIVMQERLSSIYGDSII
jgi:hypothetical protein